MKNLEIRAGSLPCWLPNKFIERTLQKMLLTKQLDFQYKGKYHTITDLLRGGELNRKGAYFKP